MLQNFIILSGKDRFRRTEEIKRYKKFFPLKYPDAEIIEVAEGASFSEITTKCFSMGLFGGSKKIIFAENFWNTKNFEQAEKTKFFEKIESETNSLTFVCVEDSLDKRTAMGKTLAKMAKVFEFKPQFAEAVKNPWKDKNADKKAAETWFKKYMQEHQIVFPERLVPGFCARLGFHSGSMIQELQKLVLFAADDQISEEIINRIVKKNPEESIWNFLDSLAQGNPQKTFEILDMLLSGGVSLYEVLPMMQREIRIYAVLVLGAEAGLSRAEIAQKSGLTDFVLRGKETAAQKFSVSKIKKMYQKLFEIDEKLKTGKIQISVENTNEFRLEIEKFIMEF